MADEVISNHTANVDIAAAFAAFLAEADAPAKAAMPAGSALPPDLAAAFAAFQAEASPTPQAGGPRVVYSVDDDRLPMTQAERNAKRRGRKIGRPCIGERPMTQAEKYAKRASSIEAKQRRTNIMVLDSETDPFDNKQPEKHVKPFLIVLHSLRFAELGVQTDEQYPDCVVFWDQKSERLIQKVSDFLGTLPEAFTIYAHNGGRFDFMFLIRKIRGDIIFKGSAIMSARIGRHSIRDSLYIIPESQRNIDKDNFDYSNMRRANRERARLEIIRYCVSDCRKLLRIVLKFIDNFGLKLTIGQASIGELRHDYPEIERLGEGMDNILRDFYKGGRVSCIAGRGDFHGDFKTFDINSSYPNVMAKFRHPIGNFWDYKIIGGGPINDETCFIELECDNYGALMGLDDQNRMSANIEHGVFCTTIHEYNMAIKYNLIENIKIIRRLDCSKQTTFEKFVIPRYENRQKIKAELAAMKARGGENSAAWFDLRDDDLFYKLVLNSSYGKTGQDPRRFKCYFITAPNCEPPEAWFASLERIPEHERELYRDDPEFLGRDYWIWHKPAPRLSFNNVGVAASVTGAARAVLLEALQHAENPLYCDTDSIICEHLQGVDMHPTRLGAWDLEDELTRVAIVGRKTYCVWHREPKKRTAAQLAQGASPDYTIKSKGVSPDQLSCDDIIGMISGGSTLTRNRAPTFDRFGGQRYIERRIRATAELRASLCPDRS
jgi:DNA polymerase elongation subunit (family B)